MLPTDLPGSIIGYRKNGTPIRLQAGGAPGDGDGEGGDGGQGGEQVVMTKEQLDKLLADARNRAYSQAEKAKAEADETKARLAELEKDQKARAKAEADAQKAAEAARKKAEEAELDAKALIDRRSQELQEQYAKQADDWANQIAELRTQAAEREAMFAKEREFQELARYTTDAVNAQRDNIAPELVKYIRGNNREEIDASIAQAIETTSAIVAGFQAAQQQARAAMPGVSSTGYTPTGPLETIGGQRALTPEEWRDMPMGDYAKARMAQGMPGSRSNERGLFG